MYLNKVLLAGRVGTEPAAFNFGGNKQGCNFRFAVPRLKKEEAIDWLDVTCFDRNAEFVLKYIRKGASVIIEGHIQVDVYTNKETNKQCSRAVIIATNVQGVVSGEGGGASANANGGQARTPRPQQSQPQNPQGGNPPPPHLRQIDDEDTYPVPF